MPFKSEAQRRKFKELLQKGKITQELYDAFENDTDRTKLLPKAEPKPKKAKVKNIKNVRVR